MNKKYKTYIKLNLVSLFCIAVSFLSITLAWFAYSGLATFGTEVQVKAWYIEFQRDKQTVSNDIVISLDDIYPGMETMHESVDILNRGDSDAQIDYEISSARILNEYLEEKITDQNLLQDALAHDYPFHLNISLNKAYALKENGNSSLDVSVSWPLDAGNDTLDSEWGSKAFQFQKQEEERLHTDSEYQVRPSLKIIIHLKAEQYLSSNESVDLNYALGNTILYDLNANQVCESIGGNCMKTTVIDTHNTVGDTTVSVLPDLFGDYEIGTFSEYTSLLQQQASKWNVPTRPLKASELLKILSKDVMNSFLIQDGLSEQLIGTLNSDERVAKELLKGKERNGYYRFSNQSYAYLSTSKCYWLEDEYDSSHGYALEKIDGDFSKIYGLSKEQQCSVVPVIEIPKTKLNQN